MSKVARVVNTSACQKVVVLSNECKASRSHQADVSNHKACVVSSVLTASETCLQSQEVQEWVGEYSPLVWVTGSRLGRETAVVTTARTYDL